MIKLLAITIWLLVAIACFLYGYWRSKGKVFRPTSIGMSNVGLWTIVYVLLIKLLHWLGWYPD